MQLWTGFILGLAGSIHCAAMCGPLILAVPPAGRTKGAAVASRVAYHSGRIAIYAVLGLLFGAVGQSVALAGFQQSVSVLAGLAILVGVYLAGRGGAKAPAIRAVGALKKAFGNLLQRRTLASNALLGSLNGLLPCGLAYTACAAAAAQTSALGGAEYMLAFGLGTVPMLAGVSLFGARIRTLIPRFWQRALPATAIVAGCLLIARGLLPVLYASASDGKPAHFCPLCK